MKIFVLICGVVLSAGVSGGYTPEAYRFALVRSTLWAELGVWAKVETILSFPISTIFDEIFLKKLLAYLLKVSIRYIMEIVFKNEYV